MPPTDYRLIDLATKFECDHCGKRVPLGEMVVLPKRAKDDTGAVVCERCDKRYNIRHWRDWASKRKTSAGRQGGDAS